MGSCADYTRGGPADKTLSERERCTRAAQDPSHGTKNALLAHNTSASPNSDPEPRAACGWRDPGPLRCS